MDRQEYRVNFFPINLKLMAALPLDPALANMADEGAIEDYREDYLNELVADLLALD